MDTIIGIVIIAFAGWVLIKMFTKKETAVDAAKEVVEEVKVEAAKVADVNKDGKVDIADAVEAVQVVKKRGRKAAEKLGATVNKVEATVKKTRAKKNG